MKPLGNEDERWWTGFKKLLDEQSSWPGEYLFKFIVPTHRLDQVRAIFGDHPVSVRASKKGTYSSVSARIRVESSGEVIAFYRAAAGIEGLLAL